MAVKRACDHSGAAQTGSDLEYSGWVQFLDGEINIVSYIVDDAPKTHVPGYGFHEETFLVQRDVSALPPRPGITVGSE